MREPRVWSGLAPAKVNLGLKVGLRRADGFHEVRTRLLALDLGDRVRVALHRGEADELELEGPFSAGLPTGPENLALRAAAGARESLGDRLPEKLAIRLEKNVPSEAGLAGGSSDAAAVIFGAYRLAGEDPGGASALEVAGAIGSDVTFFLSAAATGLGLATGRGEQVRAEALGQSLWVALLTPEAGASTAAVYGALGPRSDFEPLPTGAFDAFAEGAIENDLEAAAVRTIPELAEVRARLDACGLEKWRLSGSGASFFGLYRDGADAARGLQAARACAGTSRLARVSRSSGHGVRELWLAPASGDRS